MSGMQDGGAITTPGVPLSEKEKGKRLIILVLTKVPPSREHFYIISWPATRAFVEQKEAGDQVTLL